MCTCPQGWVHTIAIKKLSDLYRSAIMPIANCHPRLGESKMGRPVSKVFGKYPHDAEELTHLLSSLSWRYSSALQCHTCSNIQATQLGSETFDMHSQCEPCKRSRRTVCFKIPDEDARDFLRKNYSLFYQRIALIPGYYGKLLAGSFLENPLIWKTCARVFYWCKEPRAQ